MQRDGTTIKAGSSNAHGAHGFSLVEVTIAMVVLSVMLLGSLHVLVYSRAVQSNLEMQSKANVLASSLLDEILEQAYADPQTGSNVIGLDGEDPTKRSKFDDIDDYHNWTGNPPETRSGASIDWAAGLKTKVKVFWVDPANPEVTGGSNTGVKLIRVRVKKGKQILTTLYATRAESWSS